ncbi:DUF423 domain-containing protein [Flocculibacter collagenilyticus]|uniref:DUF423 domain-containing protein n=1 Tax=Flocculibacter collagenilyticus TaxID=2744479 RepID=UPI0018F2815B|nr:DUF423 domain-containing protein [Flocculibacter collagenilyticus]
MEKIILLVGSVSGALTVILGAFAAHALKGKLPAHLISVFQTGVQYQMFHALALLAVGVLIKQQVSHEVSSATPLTVAAGLFILGTVLFSGSLYLLALTQNKIWGPVTPLGGLCFILGWCVLAYAVVKS